MKTLLDVQGLLYVTLYITVWFCRDSEDGTASVNGLRFGKFCWTLILGGGLFEGGFRAP